MKYWKTAILATTILAAAQPVMAQTASPTGPWDPAGAFNGTATGPSTLAPNWSSVRISGPGCNAAGTLTPLSHDYVNPLMTPMRGFDGQMSPDQPLTARNYGSAYTSGGMNIPAGAMIMHPGPTGECSVLRLTIPAGGSGTYLVAARFAGAYANNGVSNGDGVRGMLLRNGIGIGTTVDTARGPGTINQDRVTLCPGDTLDFAVHMIGGMSYDSTLVSGGVRRVGPVAGMACRRIVDEPPVGPGVNLGTGLVTPVGDPITMTGTPNGPRSNCCAPWAGIDIIPALQPQFPNGAGGAYTHNFAISSAVDAQMSAYLNYLHAMNSNVTQLTMTVQAANLGTGGSAATSGTTIGAAQTIVWNWTPGGATMSMPGGPFWSGAPFPLTSWIGFQTTISVNGGQTGAALLGPDCRSAWSAWRAQPQQILQPGSSGTMVFETIGARGQIIRSRPVQVTPGARIQANQLPRN